MMNIKEKLQAILSYYQVNRKVGHTQAMIRGTQNVDNVIILTEGTRTQWKNDPAARNKYVDINSFNGNELRGHKLPLVIEHTAIESLFSEALNKIAELEHIISHISAESGNLAYDIQEIEKENTDLHKENENLAAAIERLEEELEKAKPVQEENLPENAVEYDLTINPETIESLKVGFKAFLDEEKRKEEQIDLQKRIWKMTEALKYFSPSSAADTP